CDDSHSIEIARRPAIISAKVASFYPPQVLQALPESREPGAPLRIGVGVAPSHHGGKPPHAVALLRVRRERPRGRAAEERDERASFHVWMAPAWQEIIWRAAQRSLAVMCPACWCSPGGLLALMGSANRVLIIRTGSMSR